MDLVSVVIPCYKQAKFLADAIESVIAQLYPLYEIVVVDDESPDDPSSVCASYPEVRYVRQRRQERCAARNRGIEESRGTFIVFLDADDRLLPEHFNSCLEELQRHPDTGFVCGDYRWFGEGDTRHVHDCRPNPDHYATLLRGNFIGPPHVVMFRREILLAVGGWDTALRSAEDQELYLRIARRYPISCHHRVIAEYRRHAEQTSQKWDLMLESAMTVLRSQWPYVKGRADYERAWREGFHVRQEMYGPPLSWSWVAAVKAGEWRRARRLLRVLLRWYPQGLIDIVQQKIRKQYAAIR